MATNSELVQLAARLDDLRAEAGLTLRELSQRLHVSDSSLSRYFTGQTLPAWNVAQGLAQLVGGDVEELLLLWDAAALARNQARRPLAVRGSAVQPVPPDWEPELRWRPPIAASGLTDRIAAAVGVLLLMVMTAATTYALTINDAHGLGLPLGL
jgi:transcriptional regulator with XRE-family HTH domain